MGLQTYDWGWGNAPSSTCDGWRQINQQHSLLLPQGCICWLVLQWCVKVRL